MYCKHAATIRSSLPPPLLTPGVRRRASIMPKKLEGSLWKNIKIEFSEAGGLYGVYPGVQLDAPELKMALGGHGSRWKNGFV